MTAFLLEYNFLPVSYVYAACGVRYWTACKVVVEHIIRHLNLIYTCKGGCLCAPLRRSIKHIHTTRVQVNDSVLRI